MAKLTKTKIRLYCCHFIQAGFPNECCDSCHEDDELGYNEMFFLEPDGQSNTEAYICCGMSRVLTASLSLETPNVPLRGAFARALLAHRRERRED